jgi:hypothetical protein
MSPADVLSEEARDALAEQTVDVPTKGKRRQERAYKPERASLIVYRKQGEKVCHDDGNVYTDEDLEHLENKHERSGKELHVICFVEVPGRSDPDYEEALPSPADA